MELLNGDYWLGPPPTNPHRRTNMATPVPNSIQRPIHSNPAPKAKAKKAKQSKKKAETDE